MASPKAPGPLAAVFDEASFIFSSIKMRGVKHYARTFAIGVAFVFLPRKLLYQSAMEKVRFLSGELSAAQATSQYSDTYKQLEMDLRAASQRLPPAVKPEIWLLDTVRDSMKAEGLVALSISPVAVTDAGNFRIVTIQLSFRAKYAEVASWVARVEGSSQLLHLSNLSIGKGGSEIGANEIQATVCSLAPKGGIQ